MTFITNISHSQMSSDANPVTDNLSLISNHLWQKRCHFFVKK